MSFKFIKGNDMKKLLIAASLVVASSGALAAGAFDGPYVQLGAGISNTSNDYDISVPGLSILNPKLANNAFMGQVLAGYSKGIGSKFNMAGNIYYDLGNDDAGSTSIVNSNVTLKTKLKNVWGVTFEPGYYFTDTTLGYVKIGYQRGDISAHGEVTEIGSADVSSGNIGALTLGVGMKQLITSNIYLGLEISNTQYGSENLTGTYNDGSGSQPIPSEIVSKSDIEKTTGIVTIGYKF